MFVLKIALRPWRQSPGSQLFTAFAVGILLFMMAFSAWMERSLGPVVERLHREQVITAYLSPALPAEQEERVADSIRVSLGASTVDVNIVRQKAFISQLGGAYPELAEELTSLGDDVRSIVPRYVSVSGALPGDALKRVQSIEGVESVESSQQRLAPAIGAFDTLRWLSRVVLAALGAILLTGIVQLVRINAGLFRDTAALLRLWGGGGTAMRLPSAISGLLAGFAGGLVALAAWLGAASSLGLRVQALSPAFQGMSPPESSWAWILLLAGSAVGLICGWIGGTSERVSARR